MQGGERCHACSPDRLSHLARCALSVVRRIAEENSGSQVAIHGDVRAAAVLRREEDAGRLLGAAQGDSRAGCRAQGT
eukprot:COSAG06_NODE_4347_length_4348_cov_2.052954_2_plen_77_part_00